jgi:hypothetical protein
MRFRQTQGNPITTLFDVLLLPPTLHESYHSWGLLSASHLTRHLTDLSHCDTTQMNGVYMWTALKAALQTRHHEGNR